MEGKKPGLETSRWALTNQQLQNMPGGRPYMNPNLATTLNLGLAQATPKSKSVPSLTAAALPGSSSPAGEEAITPKRVEELVENSVQKAALAAEVLQHDTDITVVNPPTPSPAKAKENQLPAAALPFTLRSSSLPQPSAADKMAGAKPSSSASNNFEYSGMAPLNIAARLSLAKSKRVLLSKHDDQAEVKTDEKAEQDKAEATRFEADHNKEKAAIARIANEKIKDALHEQAQRVEQDKIQAVAKKFEIREKEKAQAASKEAEHLAELAKVKVQVDAKEPERLGKQKAQAAAKEAERLAKEKAQAAAKEAERLGKQKAQAAAKEAERLGKQKAQAAAKEKEQAYAAAKEAERRAKEKAQAAAKEAERVAKEKEKAARLAREVTAKINIQKVIDAHEVKFKAFETKIDFIKDIHAKHDQEGLTELQQAESFAEEIEQDQKEISCLMTQAIGDVEKAQEAVEQAQLIVENLKEKASSLDDSLVEVNQIVSDKQKNLSGMAKDTQNQIAALKVQQDETAKKLKNLIRQRYILETYGCTANAQKVDGKVDVVAPEVATKAIAEVNGTAKVQVEASVKTHGQMDGKAKLNKPLDEAFNANPTAEERKNVETAGKLTFSAWPQVAANREELAVRRVKLSNLPSKATLKNIVSLVWGGNVQEIVYKDGQSWAEVLFVNPEDCKRYYDSTPNGIEFPGSKGRHVEVEACEPESARGNVKDMVEKVMTRCVRVVDVEPKWTKAALETLAAGNGTKRPVESVVTGLDNKGRRIVEFRFGKIADALLFKSDLHRSADWKLHPTGFGEDPCQTHSGIHDK